MRNTSSSLIAYKRGASLNSSTWYKNTLLTFLAESKDTGGNFSLAEASLTPGNEPPAHLHEREDELFYILEGEINAYVGKEAFRVGVGECLFLPKRKPHAIIVRSLRIRVLVLFVPAGLEECFRAMSSPAEKLELPVEGEATYSPSNREQAIPLLEKYAVRFLSPDEVAEQMPLYFATLNKTPQK